ncbi:hypothetical protein AGLY_014217 [Aphis glycines]|uniref:Uncharacterized protein n=1 Tax=Aphis glycines TaxID=307491 RepID=A0A6G0T4M9_APHGL|nr:hypothetical protein AGLY_014217 [Aphis glycines]
MDTPNHTVVIQLAAVVIIYQQTVRTPVMPHPSALSALAITHRITRDAPSKRIYNEEKIQNQVTYLSNNFSSKNTYIQDTHTVKASSIHPLESTPTYAQATSNSHSNHTSLKNGNLLRSPLVQKIFYAVKVAIRLRVKSVTIHSGSKAIFALTGSLHMLPTVLEFVLIKYPINRKNDFVVYGNINKLTCRSGKGIGRGNVIRGSGYREISDGKMTRSYGLVYYDMSMRKTFAPNGSPIKIIDAGIFSMIAALCNLRSFSSYYIKIFSTRFAIFVQLHSYARIILTVLNLSSPSSRLFAKKTL